MHNVFHRDYLKISQMLNVDDHSSTKTQNQFFRLGRERETCSCRESKRSFFLDEVNNR